MEEPGLAISLLGNWIFVWILVVSETEGAISLSSFFSPFNVRRLQEAREIFDCDIFLRSAELQEL